MPLLTVGASTPRVVFDGAATFDGTSLNDAVLSGINLLNGEVDVLTWFRVGRYACMADLSKCFRQVSVPENQRHLLLLVRFKNNHINEGEIQILKCTRHVWGVNSTEMESRTQGSRPRTPKKSEAKVKDSPFEDRSSRG